MGAVQPENKGGAQSRSIVDCEDHTISKPTLIVLGKSRKKCTFPGPLHQIS